MNDGPKEDSGDEDEGYEIVPESEAKHPFLVMLEPTILNAGFSRTKAGNWGTYKPSDNVRNHWYRRCEWIREGLHGRESLEVEICGLMRAFMQCPPGGGNAYHLLHDVFRNSPWRLDIERPFRQPTRYSAWIYPATDEAHFEQNRNNPHVKHPLLAKIESDLLTHGFQYDESFRGCERGKLWICNYYELYMKFNGTELAMRLIPYGNRLLSITIRLGNARENLSKVLGIIKSVTDFTVEGLEVEKGFAWATLRLE